MVLDIQEELTSIPHAHRRVLNNGQRVVFDRVLSDDSSVLQCNASNKHGYIFANAYLNVVGQSHPCLL